VTSNGLSLRWVPCPLFLRRRGVVGQSTNFRISGPLLALRKTAKGIRINVVSGRKSGGYVPSHFLKIGHCTCSLGIARVLHPGFQLDYRILLLAWPNASMGPSGSLGNSNVFLSFSIDVVIVELWLQEGVVVANYPQMTDNPLVPENPTTMQSVPSGVYADAKFICGNILFRTMRAHPDHFHATVVRIAQISGSTCNGYWNLTEYIPFLAKSSQILSVLPDLSGILSWCPVDGVTATLGELLMSFDASNFTYHIDIFSREPWKDIISILARELQVLPANVLPYDQWVDRMRRFRGSIKDNPALQLIDFFDSYVVPMSCGGLMLDTSKTSEDSETLRNMGPIGSNIVRRYIRA
jgi:hypothetical protein